MWALEPDCAMQPKGNAALRYEIADTVAGKNDLGGSP
jgi:hypothetical protein